MTRDPDVLYWRPPIPATFHVGELEEPWAQLPQLVCAEAVSAYDMADQADWMWVPSDGRTLCLDLRTMTAALPWTPMPARPLVWLYSLGDAVRPDGGRT